MGKDRQTDRQRKTQRGRERKRHTEKARIILKTIVYEITVANKYLIRKTNSQTRPPVEKQNTVPVSLSLYDLRLVSPLFSQAGFDPTGLLNRTCSV